MKALANKLLELGEITTNRVLYTLLLLSESTAVRARLSGALESSLSCAGLHENDR